MLYIDNTPNPSGAYPNPKNQPFPNCIVLSDEQAAVFFQYNGFVAVTQDAGNVIVVPNIEAWEAWKASSPEPEPTAEEQIAALKAGLEATDYKIIKCSEYQLAGLELPYDVAALHAERQALRDEINALEAEA